MATPQYGIPQPLPHQQQFIIINPNQMRQMNRHRTPTKVEYAADCVKTVRCLTVIQLVLGFLIFVFHCVTTGINDHFINQIAVAETRYSVSFGYRYEGNLVDHAATGIWAGLVIIISAAVGLAGAKYQKKGLIISHLCLNVLLLFVIPPLLGTSAVTIGGLNSCRTRGLNRYGYNDYDSYGRGTTTFRPSTFEFFGETLPIRSNSYSGVGSQFHCSAHIFKAWLALDAIILVSAILGWILTLTLVVYNSKASCKSCCCNCCCPTNLDDGNTVAYFAQPHQPQQSVQLTRTTGHVNQPTFVPPQYQYHQPTPLYTQPGNNPPVQYVSQATGPAAPMAQYPQAVGTAGVGTPTQASVAASSEEAKWQELPPEYTEVYQNAQNQQAGTQRAPQ